MGRHPDDLDAMLPGVLMDGIEGVEQLQTLHESDPTAHPHAHPGGGGALSLHVNVLTDGVTMTNAPLGGMEPPLHLGRTLIDARGTSHVRGIAVLGKPALVNGVRFEYSTDDGATWDVLVNMGTGFGDSIQKVSAWTAVPTAAKVDGLVVRAVVFGDGISDPLFRRAQLLFGTP